MTREQEVEQLAELLNGEPFYENFPPKVKYSYINKAKKIIAAGYSKSPTIHSCKCQRHPDAAFTARQIDDELIQCPQCGGIIVPKSPAKGLVPIDEDKVRLFLCDWCIKEGLSDLPIRHLGRDLCKTFGVPSVSVEQIREVVKGQYNCNCEHCYGRQEGIIQAIHRLYGGKHD